MLRSLASNPDSQVTPTKPKRRVSLRGSAETRTGPCAGEVLAASPPRADGSVCAVRFCVRRFVRGAVAAGFTMGTSSWVRCVRVCLGPRTGGTSAPAATERSPAASTEPGGVAGTCELEVAAPVLPASGATARAAARATRRVRPRPGRVLKREGM